MTEHITREEYEAEYLDIDVEPRTDNDLVAIAAAGLSNGQHEHWPVFDRVMLALDIQRGTSAIAEGITPTPTLRGNPAKTGQLWEGCERCEREPVYMPLFLCEDCWPKA